MSEAGMDIRIAAGDGLIQLQTGRRSSCLAVGFSGSICPLWSTHKICYFSLRALIRWGSRVRRDTRDTQEHVSQNSAFLVILGIMLAMIGAIAMAAPLAAGIAVEMFVGVMMLSRGAMQLYYGIKVRHWGHRFGSYMGLGSIAMALLCVAVGVLLLINPIAGLRFLTLLLAVYLVLMGGFEILHSIELSAVRGWGFVMLSGAISVALGVLIWRQWPLSGHWAMGVMVGASFIASAASMVMLGLAGRASLATLSERQSA
jgi:uncharacterized membrane protein HdeD (DUF308 family)